MKTTKQFMLLILTVFAKQILAQTASDYCSVNSERQENYITDVVFAGIENLSGNGTNGYTNFTSKEASVYPNESYGIGVNTKWNHWGYNVVQVWIDWNQNFIFEDTERAFYKTGTGLLSSNISVPLDAKIGRTTMRVRYSYAEALSPCNNNVQKLTDVEDYTVIVNNPLKPSARFDASIYHVKSRKDVVEYRDISANTPTSWHWEFEGGIPSSSTEQNPSVTYPESGKFSVKLIVKNQYGEDEIFIKDYIIVELPIDEFCSSSNERPNGQYITAVEFAGIVNHTQYNSGYELYEFPNATVEKGPYTNLNEATVMSIKVNNRWEGTKVGLWVDWNQDDDFDDAGEERILTNNQSTSNQFTFFFIVPDHAKIGKTRLRIRTVHGTNLTSCGESWFGETEDYVIYVAEQRNRRTAYSLNGLNEVIVNAHPVPSKDGNITFTFNTRQENINFKFFNDKNIEVLPSQSFSNKNTINLDLSSLPSGTYFVQTITNSESNTSRIILD